MSTFFSGANPDSYNKTVQAGKGTLIQNWYEEYTLRDETGVGRAVPKDHIKKNHDELYLSSTKELKHIYSQTKPEETFGRVFGRTQEPNYVTEQRQQFTKRSHPKEGVGKKFSHLERQLVDTVKQEIDQIEKQKDDLRNQRDFVTSYETQFLKKDLTENAIGRRVMRDQNGNAVLPENRDIDLLVDHGFLKHPPLASDEDLRNAVKKESYVHDQPITFWTEKAKEGNFYNSKITTETHPFTKNNDFIKTFPNYSHIKK